MAEPKEPLTERELEVVRLLGVAGAGNKEIAAQLFLSPNTVKVHLRNIFTKLEATSRTEVIMIAIRNGWIAVNQPVPPNSETVEQSAASEPPQISANARNQSDETTSSQDAPTASPPDAPSSEANVVVPPQPTITVPVAPNPQAIPAMDKWRRVVLLASFLVLVLFIAFAVPPNTIGYADTFDPLRIGPSQPRNGLLSRGESSRWYLRAPLPAARARAVAIAAGSHIYVIGGEVNQTVSADVMVYEPLSNTWTLAPSSKPTAVANTAAVAVGNRIYVAGGTTADGSPSNALESYDVAAGRWTVLAPLPARLAGHAMVALDNQLYVFGGVSDGGTTDASYRYDITQNTWHPIAPMPGARSLMAADTVNPKGTLDSARIYVIGGFNDGRELATCAFYAPDSDSWDNCAPMTIPRSALGLARVGTNLYAIGGGSTGFIGFNERYDALTDRWTPLETPVTSDWQSTAVASMPSEFFVFGGYNNGERLAFTYVYEVFTNRVYVPAFLATDSQGKKP